MSDDATLRARKSMRGALIIAGLQVGGCLLLTLAHQLKLIDSDTTTRGAMVIIGLGLAAIGNSMPKAQEGPPAMTAELVAVRQSITRIGGWAMALGGLVWAALWAFAPRDVALVGGIAAVGGGALVMLAYAVWRFQAHRRAGS